MNLYAMICSLTIARYPKLIGFAGIVFIPLCRIVFLFSKRIKFYKLMGCGKNGSFDIRPDWNLWVVLTVTDEVTSLNKFVKSWYNLFKAEVCSIQLKPIEGHGNWDGKQVFGNLPKKTDYNGNIAVLTRATIKLNKLSSFWNNVNKVGNSLKESNGCLASIGIGEVPFIKQATISIWHNKQSMQDFAYKMKNHAEIIKKTHHEGWYSEEMFVRFIPLKIEGSIKGIFEYNL